MTRSDQIGRFITLALHNPGLSNLTILSACQYIDAVVRFSARCSVFYFATKGFFKQHTNRFFEGKPIR